MKQQTAFSTRIILAVQALLLLFVALAPFVLIPVCPAMPNGTYMSCHYTGVLLTIVASVLLLITLIQLIKPVRWLVIAGSIFVLIGSALCYLIPNQFIPLEYSTGHLIGLCGRSSMQCHITFYWVGIVLIAVSLIALVHALIQAMSRRF